MENRIEKIMKVIENNNLDAVALIAGPNMAYLTGADFHLMERPTVIIFSKNYKPVAILPNLEVDSFKSLSFYKEVSDSQKNIYNAEIISWKDSEGFNDAFVKAGETIGNLKKIGVEGKRMRVFEFDIMKKAFPNAEIMDTHKEIVEIRLCKDDSEIQNLRKAIKISEDALETTLKNVKEDMTELQIAQDLIVNQYKLGAHSLAFNPLVLIGENAALPHGHSGDRKLKKGDALLIDFGCVYNGYTSDFTRTYFYKEVSDSHKNIYEVVQKANEIGRNITKIGTSLHDVDDTVTCHLEQSAYSNCIGHRTGHGLGMDVHEDPYVTRGNHQILAKGMVITIEPGLYDVGNVGVRIEDNVLVTDSGHESLTVLPRDLTII